MASRTSPAPAPEPSPPVGLTPRHAVVAAVVVSIGLVSLTPLTWAQLGQWVLVGATVAGSVTLGVYVAPFVRRLVSWLTPHTT